MIIEIEQNIPKYCLIVSHISSDQKRFELEIVIMKLNDKINAEKVKNEAKINDLELQLSDSRAKIAHLESEVAILRKGEGKLKVRSPKIVSK